MSIDEEWQNFLDAGNDFSDPNICSHKPTNQSIQCDNKNTILDPHENSDPPPLCEELYISTKTKVLFLSSPIDINTVFWRLPVIRYSEASNGIIKKQMKVVSDSEEHYEEYQKKLNGIDYYHEHIIKQINNPNARKTKYKDERKITVGISKKDIMNCRGKVKSAFYNCFAMIVRFLFEGNFREIHVKVFNTGKLEIPGILNDKLLDIIRGLVLTILQPHVSFDLSYKEVNEEDNNVLINSNFKCGYYINRDKLYSILRSSKYGIETSYDPCSYPGVKCKYYFNNDIEFDEKTQRGQIVVQDRAMKMSELGENVKYTEISFMIFRTGSCLIVGNCTERILRFVYEFIKKLLYDEFHNIQVENTDAEIKEKKVKVRKKTITMSKVYYDTHCTV